ncbi:MAG: DUF58 domain-containing protein [Pseudomonadota bacterium]
MWRWSYRVFSAVSGIWFWTTRRFTGAGFLALGTLVTAGALGIDTNQTLAYQIFTFLCALIAAAMLAARLLRPKFQVARVLPRMITAGQTFDYRVLVKNLGTRRADGLALLEDLSDPRPTFAEFRSALRFPTYRGWWRLSMRNQVAHIDETALPALAPCAEAEVRVRGLAYRRGTLRLKGASVARADPLGLFRRLTRIGLPDKLIVLPRRYSLPRLTLPGARRYQHGGVALASSVGESEEFMSLRDYRPGDPLQRIHWKSYARSGKPVVKEYQDEFFERHALVLDTFTDRDNAAFEEAVSLAASFACTLDTQESLLDLMFVGVESYCYTAGRGQMQPESLVEILAGVHASADRAFRRLHDAVLARRAALSGCILILLAWDEARQALVRALQQSGLPLKVLVVSERDIEAAPAWLRVLRPGKIQEGLAEL